MESAIRACAGPLPMPDPNPNNVNAMQSITYARCDDSPSLAAVVASSTAYPKRGAAARDVTPPTAMTLDRGHRSAAQPAGSAVARLAIPWRASANPTWV
jgi:hypothetical protein